MVIMREGRTHRKNGTWHTLLTYMSEEERATEADLVPGWLRAMLATLPEYAATAGHDQRPPAR